MDAITPNTVTQHGAGEQTLVLSHGVACEQNMGRQHAEEPAEAEDPAALRVLLVEDNPTNQEVVRLILSTCEVSLAIADNGRLGVDAWAEGRFDVVLMDLQMPVMDGLSAIREIRQREAELGLPRTPIAVLSANAMEHHKRESLSVGADLHLSKPITASALIDGIAQALALVA
jgi:CheY-like chemotaxis protein